MTQAQQSSPRITVHSISHVSLLPANLSALYPKGRQVSTQMPPLMETLHLPRRNVSRPRVSSLLLINRFQSKARMERDWCRSMEKQRTSISI